MSLANLLTLGRKNKRLAEIVTVLGKYGLADWLSGLDYDWLHGRLTAPDGKQLASLTQAGRIRVAMTELGPTFIKLGQILSTRADLVGPELAAELAKLQSSTPADLPEVAAATVESELGAPPGEVFEDFEAEAFASASIGQVHRARVGGTAVVVKVQHEGIQDKIRNDLDILAGLAELAEKHATELRAYRPVDTIAEFKRVLLAELDFSRERRSLDAFTRNFADDETVRFPAAFADRSSQRVLTMEMLDGVSLSKAERLREEGKDLNEFARRGVTMYLNMVFRDGLYHADPHPGNLLYLDGGVVGVLDCGMVGRIDDQLRTDFEELLLAIATKQPEQLTDLIVRIGSIPPGLDRGRLRSDISEFLTDYATQSIKEFDLSGALNRVTEIVREHRIVLPANCTMLIKTLVMLEGTAQKLSPEFSLGEVIAPYQSEIVKRRYSPQRLLQRLQRTYRDWDQLVDALPRSINDILGRIQQGSFDINLEHRRLDNTVNRLVLGILCSALFVGSTLLWALHAPPLIGGVSVFGLLGYLFAVFLGYRLLRAIPKSGGITPRD